MSSSAERSGCGAARRWRSSSTRCSPATRSAGWRSCDWSRWSNGWRQIWRSAVTPRRLPSSEALVRDHPLRENLRRLLILALYRAGRQADALAVMQDARASLRDELGLDPSQALQQLEKAILLQDPSLLPVGPPQAEPRCRRALRDRRDLQHRLLSVPPAAPSTRTARASATHAALRSWPTPLSRRARRSPCSSATSSRSPSSPGGSTPRRSGM